MKAQRPVPDSPERDDPAEPNNLPPPMVNRLAHILSDAFGGFNARLSETEARVFVLTWLTGTNLIILLVLMAYVFGVVERD